MRVGQGCFTRLPRVAAYNSEVSWGRSDQDNKDQTPVGYSRGTGVSTGGLATAVLGVVARDTPGVHGFVWGRATLLLPLRCMRCGAPRECNTGLWAQPADPGAATQR